MIRTILIWLAVGIVALLIVLWLLTGGPRKIADAARGISNPISSIFFASSTGGGPFRLPWQPEDLVHGPTVGISEEGTEEPQTPEEELAATQKEYDAIVLEMQQAKNFGEPSPSRGMVLIDAANAEEGGSSEYVRLDAASGNPSPVNVGGWSVQSAVTGVRAYIPRAATTFVMGDVNAEQDVYLNPGAAAFLTSGASPVGTSFRENMCTGYLGKLQRYTPSLGSNCPPPTEELPLTADNLKTYGDACFDFVRSLPSCTFPLSIPPEVAPVCRIFLTNNLSYNGCVGKYRYKTSFARDSWRLYLSAGAELWRNSHDVIKLLDKEGRTVDVVSY